MTKSVTGTISDHLECLWVPFPVLSVVSCSSHLSSCNPACLRARQEGHCSAKSLAHGGLKRLCLRALAFAQNSLLHVMSVRPMFTTSTSSLILSSTFNICRSRVSMLVSIRLVSVCLVSVRLVSSKSEDDPHAVSASQQVTTIPPLMSALEAYPSKERRNHKPVCLQGKHICNTPPEGKVCDIVESDHNQTCGS